MTDEQETFLKVDFDKYPGLKVLALRCITLKPFCLPSQLEELDMIGGRLLEQRVRETIDAGDDASDLFSDSWNGAPCVGLPSLERVGRPR